MLAPTLALLLLPHPQTSAPATQGPEVEEARTTAPANPPAHRGLDLEGRLRDPRAESTQGAFVVVTLATTCPIANGYLPELGRIAEDAARLGVPLFGLHSDRFGSRAEALAHAEEYSIRFPVLFDDYGEWASVLTPSHTPEAFVVGQDGQVLYRGRIDDRHAELGQQRPEPTDRSLWKAIQSVVDGVPPVPARTEVVGCIFEPWPAVDEAKAEVTYHRHIGPLLGVHCLECHRIGEVAPFPLANYPDAARRARMLAHVTEERIMPPWHAAPGHVPLRNERILSEREIALIRRWVEAGSPEGAAEDAPPPRKFESGWRLGEPDLVLEPTEGFGVPAEGRDHFRCFVLPTGLDVDQMVVGVEFQAGDPSVVHHAILFVDERGRARKLDAEDPGPGYERFGGIGFDSSGTLGGWAPGAQAQFLPPGMGRRLARGADVVLQIHYHPSGKATLDRSRVGLYLEPRGTLRRVRDLTLGTDEIDIPPGDEDYVRRTRRRIDRDVDVIGMIPHMHWLGQSMRVQATLPGGETRMLIEIPEYDFDWQTQYLYAKPLRLPAGTLLELEAHYDNSTGNPDNPANPPKRVRYGEETHDEMCFCFLQVARAPAGD